MFHEKISKLQIYNCSKFQLFIYNRYVSNIVRKFLQSALKYFQRRIKANNELASVANENNSRPNIGILPRYAWEFNSF